MNRCIIGTTVGLLLFMGGASATAWAQDGPPGRRGRMGPPLEAIQACLDKNEGTVVEVITPRGDKLKATCKQMDGQLVAVPSDRFRGRMGPPLEAIQACLDKNEGTVVEVITPRGDKLKATCKQMDGQLVAIPNDRYRGPKGNPPDDAESKQ